MSKMSKHKKSANEIINLFDSLEFVIYFLEYYEIIRLSIISQSFKRFLKDFFSSYKSFGTVINFMIVCDEQIESYLSKNYKGDWKKTFKLFFLPEFDPTLSSIKNIKEVKIYGFNCFEIDLVLNFKVVILPKPLKIKKKLYFYDFYSRKIKNNRFFSDIIKKLGLSIRTDFFKKRFQFTDAWYNEYIFSRYKIFFLIIMFFVNCLFQI